MNPRWLIAALVLLPTPVASTPPTVRLALGGDVMFGRVVDGEHRPHPADELKRWSAPLKAADVAIVNLETAICERGKTTSLLPLLWAPPARLDALVDAGVDVVNVANNHAMDCGPDSVTGTVAELDRRGIAVAGLAADPIRVLSPEVVVVGMTLHPPPYANRGQRVVVVGKDTAPALKLVAKARAEHPNKLIVVSVHWGRERNAHPAASQRDLARAMVDAGADVVAGHGPHTPQPIERYKARPIYYSLGNLAFDDASPIGRSIAPKLLTFRYENAGWRID